MYLSKITIFFLLFIATNTVSDISLLNCPSSYLKSTPTQSQKGFIDFGETLYKGYQTQSYDKSVYKIVMQGDTLQFDNHSKVLQIPYIIVGVIFLIVMIFVILWCIFSRTCPPWQWTKRDLLANPYNKKEMRYTTFWLFIFSLTILVISVLIMSQIPNLKVNLEQTKCSIYVTVDTALNGSGNSWSGFSALKNNIGNISSLISSTTTQIGLYFTGDDWLKDDMSVMKTKNNIIYTQNKDSQLVSPNPDKTETQVKQGFPAPLIDSVFIRKGLGPIGQAKTLTTSIQIGLNVTEELSNQAYLIDRSARFLDDSALTIKQNFVLAQNILNMYIHQLQVYLDDLQVLVDLYFVQYFSTFLYLIQFILAICLIGTMLILVGTFAASIFHILDCRKMVHIGWFIYSCSFLGGLILMYLFIGIGSIGYGFCNYYKGILTGQQVFQQANQENNQNILSRLDACMYGKGDSLQTFRLSDQIKTLQELYLNIKTYDDYTNINSSNYVNVSYSIQTLKKWISIVQKYKLGIYIDSNSNQTNQDNPNYALSQLNLYSNTGGGVKTCSKDRWVFDKANCTDSGQQTYVTLDQTNGGLITTNKVLCISFNEGYALNHTIPWTQDDFTKRYIQTRQNCNGAYQNIMKFGNNLISFRDSRKNLFQGIEDSLNQILNQNNDFNSLLKNFRSRVTQFSDSTKTLKNLLLSQSKGIKYTTNCTVIGQKIKDTYTVFCRNFMSQIARMGLLAIILSIALLFGIWTGSLFAVRYSQIQRHQNLNMPQSEVDSERIISDKKSDGSDE